MAVSLDTRKEKIRRGFIVTLSYFILITYALFMISPFLWIFSGAFKEEKEIITYPPTILPTRVTLENINHVISNQELMVAIRNSLICSFGNIAISTLIPMFAGYSFARFDFKGKDFLRILLLLVMLIPGNILIVPIYFFFANLGLLDTLIGLILVYATGSIPLNTILLSGYFLTIPKDLEEAAMVDGDSRIAAFVKITLPLAAPALAACVIFAFVDAWREFIIALILTHSKTMRTFPVALYYFVGIKYGTVEWGPLCAAVFLSTIPLIIIFLFFQRYFIYGLTGGAIKG